jgi:Na+/proline symporter
MANLSAALNSLSSTTIVDFYSRLNPRASEQRRVQLSRVATVVWGLALFALAIVARRGGRVLEAGLSIASVAYGSLLGVFMLGVLTRKANESGAMVGMICGFGLNLYLWQYTRIPFTWYVALGSVTTVAIGYGASVLLAGRTAVAAVDER